MLRNTMGTGCLIQAISTLQRCTDQSYLCSKGVGKISRKKRYVTFEWPFTKRYREMVLTGMQSYCWLHTNKTSETMTQESVYNNNRTASFVAIHL